MWERRALLLLRLLGRRGCREVLVVLLRLWVMWVGHGGFYIVALLCVIRLWSLLVLCWVRR